MKHLLIDKISEHVKLNPEEKNFIKSFWKEKTIEQEDYLLTNGEISKTDNFIIKGTLKAFYINPKTGKEEIVYFAIENWWATDIESFQKQKPSLFNIQALERTDLLQINYESFQKMLFEIPKLERFFRIILENYIGSLQKRMIGNHIMTAEERYKDFLESYPDISKRVPNYLIASYLGITPEFLSRIRNKIFSS
ncbi:Crp/Fnr family transcriptional regulator [Gramella sp. AN32]|uniref:Crp/Fnr family transcriptional regulator n=1 Tax=Christiangramia antarctica TaxID=2058158 RepID=A0ABW5X6R8_9FLAO|nr:Crp/Fnr family transcriptional regulator [Gramella sp. AN32]MCM4157823.1 Crp/Fnr family transcriptional regulator [Gramella sp. AN32]